MNETLKKQIERVARQEFADLLDRIGYEDMAKTSPQSYGDWICAFMESDLVISESDDDREYDRDHKAAVAVARGVYDAKLAEFKRGFAICRAAVRM